MLNGDKGLPRESSNHSIQYSVQVYMYRRETDSLIWGKGYFQPTSSEKFSEDNDYKVQGILIFHI